MLLLKGNDNYRQFMRWDAIKRELYRISLDDFKEKWETLEERICWMILKEGNYIITDKDVIETLRIYTNNYEEFLYLNVEMPHDLVKTIAIYPKDLGLGFDITATKESINVETFMKEKWKLLRSSEQSFPIVLYKNNLSEQEKRCPLWIEKIVSCKEVYNLSNSGIIEKYNADMNGYFFLLPFSEKCYIDVMDRYESRSLTKEIYDEIMHDETELSLFARWTCKYQRKGMHVRYGNIVDMYKELIEKIYLWVFKN